MTYRALATDYDGTIAHDGRVDDATLRALRQARRAHMVLVLVTGRELASLFNAFADCDLFDRIVAENGGVLHDPSSQSVEVLGSPPPHAFIETLQRAGVPVSVGHSIVATVKPFEDRLRAAIADSGLPWHVVLNKNAVMALPIGVDKGTGLHAAMVNLAVPLGATAGVGDAENDEAFLRVCGLSAAVDNAVPELKAQVHLVTRGARGDGVRELIAHLLTED